MNRFELEKRSFLKRLMLTGSISAIFVLLLSLHACERELDIRTDFPFEVEVMPVPKAIGKGETVTIRCKIRPEQKFEGAKYYMRYFQYDGEGKLLLESNQVLKPNDSYKLLKVDEEFRLYFISTISASQAFDIWFFDNQGHEKRISFQFNNKS